MARCTCGPDKEMIATAKQYGWPTDGFPTVTCPTCLAERAREEEAQRDAFIEEQNRKTFMSLPEHPDRWDAVFDFMYSQGYRPADET